MSFDIIRYLYGKWLDTDCMEEKFEILVDLLNGEEEFAEAFDIDMDTIEYFDKFDIVDFMEEREEEIDDIWRAIIRNYDENEYLEDEDIDNLDFDKFD